MTSFGFPVASFELPFFFCSPSAAVRPLGRADTGKPDSSWSTHCALLNGSCGVSIMNLIVSDEALNAISFFRHPTSVKLKWCYYLCRCRWLLSLLFGLVMKNLLPPSLFWHFCPLKKQIFLQIDPESENLHLLLPFQQHGNLFSTSRTFQQTRFVKTKHIKDSLTYIKVLLN